MTDEHLADLMRGATHARDEYGMGRLYENVLDLVAEINHKDELINTLLDRIEQLEQPPVAA